MLKNIPREQVLKVVQQKGPTIPVHIVKELGGDTFLIGAILSQLAESKHIKITHVKRGGTPFYYTPEQKNKLQELNQYLNEKDKRTFARLKEAKVLKDSEQEPLTRASLRMIRDFAKPLEVNIKGEQHLFWKFYLVNNEEVKNIIKEKYLKKPEIKPKLEEVKQEKVQEVQKQEIIQEKTPEIKETPTETKKEDTKTEKQEENITEKKTEPQSKPKKERTLQKKDTTAGGFAERMRKYFERKDIEIIEQNIIRKTEIDYVLRLPTAIGSVEYYCKAKDKKKSNEGDIATAYIQGQGKKLPVLFLTTGDITKKAKDMLHKEFKGVVINRV